MGILISCSARRAFAAATAFIMALAPFMGALSAQAAWDSGSGPVAAAVPGPAAPGTNQTYVRYWADKVIPTGESGIYSGYEIHLSGNLTVEAGGFLWLENSTVYLEGAHSGNRVTVNGTLLFTKGSEMAFTGNGSYRAYFNPGAAGSVSESRFAGMGDGSVVIRSPLVKFSRVEFEQSSVVIENTTARLDSCAVSLAYRGIYAAGSDVTLNGTSVAKSYICLEAHNSTVSAFNSTFESLSKTLPGAKDIVLGSTSADIVNSTFAMDKVMLADNASAATVQWLVSVQANSTNGPLANATVEFSRPGSGPAYNFTTGPDGWLREAGIAEYVLTRNATSGGQSVDYLGSYIVRASQEGYVAASTQVNVTSNMALPLVLKAKYGKDWKFINGDWVVSGTEVVDNMVILLSGNLTVKSPGSLTLSNSTLIMNCTANGTCAISVEGGAALRLLFSSVRAYNASMRYGFTFGPGSTGKISDSAISSAGYPGGGDGVEIDGALVDIYNTQFTGCRAGLRVRDSVLPLLALNTFSQNDLYGVWATNSSVSFLQCQATANGAGAMLFEGTQASIIDSHVWNHTGFGIRAAGASGLTGRSLRMEDNNLTISLEQSSCSLSASTLGRQQVAIDCLGSNLTVEGTAINQTLSGIAARLSGVTVSGCNISEANYTGIDAADSSVAVSSGAIYACGYGVLAARSSLNMTGTRVLSCRFDGVKAVSTPASGFVAAQCTFINNSGSAVYIQDSGAARARLDYNRLERNNYGVSVVSARADMQNNTVSNNSLYGLYCRGGDVRSSANAYAQFINDLYMIEKSQLVCVNDSFSRNATYRDATSKWSVYWHVVVSVMDSFGTPVPGANISFQNAAGGKSEYRMATGPSGLTGTLVIQEMTASVSLATYYNPYRLTVSKRWAGDSYSSATALNVTAGMAPSVYISGLDLPPRPVVLEQPDYVTEKTTYLRWSVPPDQDLQNTTSIYAYIAGGPVPPNLTPITVLDSVKIPTAFISGLQDNTLYTIYVEITDKSGQSASSNSVTIKTLQASPPPATLAAGDIGASAVNLTWDESPINDFLRYDVLVSLQANFSVYNISDSIGEQNRTFAAVGGLEEDTVYYFMVRTYDTENGIDSPSYGDSNVVMARTGILNRQPALYSPSSSPTHGYTTTVFRLSVTYSDPDNDNPKAAGTTGYVRANVSGISYDMLELSPADKTYSDGKIYYLDIVVPISGFYDVYFECNDGAKKYNFTVKTEPMRISVEKPRELQFADLAYVALVIGLLAIVCVLLLALWNERRKGRSGHGRARIPGISALDDRIGRKLHDDRKKEKQAARAEYAKGGVPDGLLQESMKKVPPAGAGLTTPSPVQEDGKAAAEPPAVATPAAVPEGSAKRDAGESRPARKERRHCGLCGNPTSKSRCAVCGAQVKKYIRPGRVGALTTVLSLVLLLAPLAIWAGTAGLVAWKGTGYIYPNHTLRLVIIAAILASSPLMLYLGLWMHRAVSSAKRTGYVRCRQCGARLNVASRYCHNCGASAGFFSFLLN